jgi:hypothetical protein
MSSYLIALPEALSTVSWDVSGIGEAIRAAPFRQAVAVAVAAAVGAAAPTTAPEPAASAPIMIRT